MMSRSSSPVAPRIWLRIAGTAAAGELGRGGGELGELEGARGPGVARLKSTRASTSSCGSGGSDEKVISGAETRPSTVTIAVTSSEWVRATKWSSGSRLPTSCSEPSSNSMRWPSTTSRPRRRSNWPTGWMSVVGALDAQLAAELDVEAAAAHEDLVRRVRSARRGRCRRGRGRRGGSRRRRPGRGPGWPRTARRRVDVVDLVERRLGVGAETLGDRDLGAAEVDLAREQPAAADQRARAARARRRAGC